MNQSLLEENYEAIRGQYELAAKHVKDWISAQTSPFKIQDIQYRAKSPSSFINKAKKLNDDGTLKYPDPFREITDFAGVRLICFLKRDVDPICDLILELFESDSFEDVGERVFQKGRFGYQSKHILVRLPKTRYLPACDFVDDVVCEIQVRTLLQHAWAEMEHDIQYKGEGVPDSLRKRFVALAGLLEIADGEFERIESDNDALKSKIEGELISRLTSEAFSESKIENDEPQSKGTSLNVRSLISEGKYSEALAIYSDKIELNPNSHTLFIGRAKVKFLLGDSQGALRDLNSAENINSNDPAINHFRNLIADGNIEYINTANFGNVNLPGIADVFENMLKGEGKIAFDIISDLEEQGYNRAFASINKASCCLLELDTIGAREYLGRLKTLIGATMSVEIHILKYFIALIEEDGENEELNELSLIVSAVPSFRIQLSTLLNFLSGFKLRHRIMFNRAQKALSQFEQLKIPVK